MFRVHRVVKSAVLQRTPLQTSRPHTSVNTHATRIAADMHASNDGAQQVHSTEPCTQQTALQSVRTEDHEMMKSDRRRFEKFPSFYQNKSAQPELHRAN